RSWPCRKGSRPGGSMNCAVMPRADAKNMGNSSQPHPRVGPETNSPVNQVAVAANGTEKTNPIMPNSSPYSDPTDPTPGHVRQRKPIHQDTAAEDQRALWPPPIQPRARAVAQPDPSQRSEDGANGDAHGSSRPNELHRLNVPSASPLPRKGLSLVP